MSRVCFNFIVDEKQSVFDNILFISVLHRKVKLCRFSKELIPMPEINCVFESQDKQLQSAIDTLSNYYPLRQQQDGSIEVTFKKNDTSGNSYSITRDENGDLLIEYEKLHCALRGLGTILSLDDTNQLKSGFTEETTFKTMGIMLDCSRNAVITVEHFKKWLNQLALLGYNMAMLYTEDTYELAGESYFGYQRGRYSKEELKEIDDYASSLGIEIIGCIQTLGHLEQMLRWNVYQEIKDTSSVLLVGQKKTYEFIEKMISHIADVYRSKRIHIGMDETHDLGRGRYLDLFGYKRGFDLFNEHLEQVKRICKKYGLKPMIWSDMYFRMGSKKQEYYDDECVIPDDVKAKIPKDIELVYWDYYHTDKEGYLKMIDKHKDLGFTPIMGSGVWTWARLWHAMPTTQATVSNCIPACKETGIDEIFFTMWGDDGAYCEFDSAMAGLAYSAELMYSNNGIIDEDILKKRFGAICSADYEITNLASELDIYEGTKEQGYPRIYGASVLWDDPIYGIYFHNERLDSPDIWERAYLHYKELAKKLNSKADDDNIRHAALLAELLSKKISLRIALEQAHKNKNNSELKKLLDEIPVIIDLYDKVDRSFRKSWLKRNKVFGLDTIQRRLASIIRRYRELIDRISEIIEGKIDKIQELEIINEKQKQQYIPYGFHTYRNVISGTLIQ